jgi:hypothetical protein
MDVRCGVPRYGEPVGERSWSGTIALGERSSGAAEIVSD